MRTLNRLVIESSTDELKKKQLDILLKTNQMKDDYHTGIRNIDDILTFEEAMKEAESDYKEYGQYSSYPDVKNDDLKKALKTNKIDIYSSKEITNGTFVTPSKMQAKDYAGDDDIYEMTVNLEDIAWINIDEGEYAKVD